LDDEEARRIGDAGEMKVAVALSKLQPLYGFAVLHDVLISTHNVHPVTAQLDHIVIDDFGIIILETKARTHALIKGTSADSTWTACYPGTRKNHTFSSPLRQNESHVSLLYQLLKTAHPGIHLDRVRSLVVFVDADVSRLELDSVSASRVTTVEGLPVWFADRNTFAPAQPMSTSERVDLMRAIVQLDRSGDQAAEQAHADYRRNFATSGSPLKPPGASARSGRRKSGATPVEPVTAPTHQAARDYLGDVAQREPFGMSAGRLALMLLGVTAAVFTLWAVVGLFRGSAPPWVYVLAFILVAAFGGESSDGNRRRRRSRTPASRPTPLGQRVVVLTLILGLGAGLLLGVNWFLRNGLQSLVPTNAQGVLQATPPTATPDVAAAQAALRDADPNIYRALVDSDHPVVSSDGGNVAYQWEYLEKAGKGSVKVKTIRITLDGRGSIIGTRMP